MTDYLSDEKKRLELASNIASEVGHELGNPLAVIRGYLQLIKKKSNPDIQNYLTICLKELDYITLLYQSFITLVRNNPASLQEQDLNYLIKNLIKLLNSYLYKHKAAIQIKAASDLPLFNCRTQDIYTLLLDIIHPNLRPDNELIIKTSSQNKYILIEIKQNTTIINSFSCFQILHDLRATLRKTENSITVFLPLSKTEQK